MWSKTPAGILMDHVFQTDEKLVAVAYDFDDNDDKDACLLLEIDPRTGESSPIASLERCVVFL